MPRIEHRALGHSLTIHCVDPCTTDATGCPMQKVAGLNFVTQLRTADFSFGGGKGQLSIKCAFGGQEFYEVEGGRVAVDDSSYLVLNNQQHYASSIERPGPMESFCVWFRPGFADQVLAGLRTRTDLLLDDPNGVHRQPVQFFERLFPHDGRVSPVLHRIRAAVNEGRADGPWLEEQFHVLLERLLAVQRSVYPDVQQIPALKLSTRIELYRRLYRAKDYLDANLTSSVMLPDVAAVAELSAHHFLRLFKEVFRETPRQYHRRRRMEKARDMLLRTDLPVTQICYDVGFESLGTFSWFFRQSYGVPPSEYRRQGRKH
jgi:AraC family transcriptional regulator